MSEKQFTTTECNALRGFAILGIILHNFCHWLPDIVEENEFEYALTNAEKFNHAVFTPDTSLPLHLFSFWGHYGVAVFLFLSAYGLVYKYEKTSDNIDNTSPETISVFQFIKKHYLKLLKYMIPGYLIWVIVLIVKNGSYDQTWIEILSQMFMVTNFLPYFYPYPIESISPGPYWFFGMILQLYIIYRCLIYKKSRWFTIGLIVLCMLIQMLFQPDETGLEWLRTNFFGSMLAFGLGILYADSRDIHLSKLQYGIITILSIIVLFACEQNYYSWYFTPIFAILATIGIVKSLPGFLNRIFCKIGIISSGLFVFHPIARKFSIYTAQQGDILHGFSHYLVLSFIGAIGLYFFWKTMSYFWKKVKTMAHHA